MITEETYFSRENELKYLGHSQFLDFQKCEAAALAKVKGEIEETPSTALLVGSFVDAYFSDTLDVFKAKHPELFKRDGSLKSDFANAESIIERIERDPKMMQYLDGEKQVIMTGEIQGVPVKIKCDVLHRGKCIVDQKIMKDFAPIWVDGVGKLPFVEAWGYDIQAYMYQTVVEQNTGKKLPFIIAGATKQPVTRIELIGIPQDCIDAAEEIVKANIGRFDLIKRRKIEPERCEKCDYCAETKMLTEVVDYREVG